MRLLSLRVGTFSRERRKVRPILMHLNGLTYGVHAAQRAAQSDCPRPFIWNSQIRHCDGCALRDSHVVAGFKISKYLAMAECSGDIRALLLKTQCSRQQIEYGNALGAHCSGTGAIEFD